jgi:hypothetical protein
MKDTVIKRELDKKVVGRISNGIFKKKVRYSKHLFRTIPSWGIDTQILKGLGQQGVTLIEIYDTETKKTYFSTLENFMTNSFEDNFGYGTQRFLPLEYWQIK